LASLARAVGLTPVVDITRDVDTKFQSRGTPRPWLEVFGERNLHLIDAACALQLAALGYPRSS
jgi:hypothetical protein